MEYSKCYYACGLFLFILFFFFSLSFFLSSAHPVSPLLPHCDRIFLLFCFGLYLFWYRQQAFKLHSFLLCIVLWIWHHAVPLSRVQQIKWHLCKTWTCIFPRALVGEKSRLNHSAYNNFGCENGGNTKTPKFSC